MAKLLRALSILALALTVAPVRAEEQRSVVESHFYVALPSPDESLTLLETNEVPLIPGVCYSWMIRLSGKDELLKYREVLKLPAPPAFVSGDDDPYSPTKTSADRKTVETTLFTVPDQGVVDGGWCVVAGDPVGPHTIEIYADDQLLQRFEFELTVEIPALPEEVLPRSR